MIPKAAYLKLELLLSSSASHAQVVTLSASSISSAMSLYLARSDRKVLALTCKKQVSILRGWNRVYL